MKEKYDSRVPVVKKKSRKTKFFRYYFKEKKKIIEWNRKRYLLRFSFFKLKIRPITVLHFKIDGFYLKYLLPISRFLPEIIMNGWQWQILSIREYNTIVFFEDFCKKCSHIGASKNFLDKKYLVMEESFLKLICNPETVQILLKGLEKILIFYKKQFFKSDDVLVSLLKNLALFFSPHHLSPSFFDLIVAYNISYYRKYLEISDLITLHPRQIVPTHFFSCSREIFGMIVKFLKTTLEDVKKLQSEIAYSERLKSVSTVKENQPPAKIINFYLKYGHNWQNDCDDAFLLVLVLLEEIVNELEIFIKTEWQVMNKEEKIVTLKVVSSQKADLVYAELVKEFEYAKVRHSTSVSTQITLERFLNAENPKVIMLDQGQKYIYQKIYNAFSCLFELACIFYDIYETRSEGYKRLLHYMITHPAQWRGKPVYALFSYYIELFLQICGFFHEKKLQSKLQKYPNLMEQVKILKEKLKWTSDTQNFILKALERSEKVNEPGNEQ